MLNTKYEVEAVFRINLVRMNSFETAIEDKAKDIIISPCKETLSPR